MATVVDVVNRITGRKETGYVLQRLWDNEAGSRKPASVEELYEQLRHLERTGNLPAILAIDCVNEPFSINAEETHVLTVPSFDAEGLNLVNQWRRAWNFKLPLTDAFIAMADCRENADLLDKANLINRTRQVENGVQEIETWRLSKPGGGWSPGQWEMGVTDCLNENIARWQKRGENFKGERQQTLVKFVEVVTQTCDPAYVEDIFKLVNLPRIEIPCPSYDCW